MWMFLASTANALVCGQVLIESATLDADLVDCPGDGLVIGADGITLTFGGHSIGGTGAPGSVGVRNEGHDFVTIEDGDFVGVDIGGFETGILLEDASWNTVTDLLVGDPFSGRFGIAIVRGDHNEVRNNDVRGGSTSGCGWVEGAAIGLLDAHHNTLQGNFAHLADFGIVLVGSDHNRLLQNEAAPDFSDGNECAGIAVWGSDRNWLVGNVAANSDDRGIRVDVDSEGTRVVANVAFQNGDDGIGIDDPSTVVAENLATFNAELGIRAVAGVLDLGGNEASDNGFAAQCVNVVCGP